MATILGNNVLDKLIPVVDKLRQSINANFGTRAYRVFSVVRSYSGKDQSGYYTEVSTEILPAPKVEFLVDEFSMNGAGKFSNDEIKLTEVSLTYSKDQLMPAGLDKSHKHYLRLTDNHGENMPDKIYHLQGLPLIDREKSIGWIIYAKEIQDRNWDLNGTH